MSRPLKECLAVRRVDPEATAPALTKIMQHRCNPRLYESCVRDARRYVDLAEAASGPIPAPVTPAYPWGDALEELDRAAPDLRIINLETAVTTSGDAWPDKVRAHTPPESPR